jgi:hypothetical protein
MASRSIGRRPNARAIGEDRETSANVSCLEILCSGFWRSGQAAWMLRKQGKVSLTNSHEVICLCANPRQRDLSVTLEGIFDLTFGSKVTSDSTEESAIEY